VKSAWSKGNPLTASSVNKKVAPPPGVSAAPSKPPGLTKIEGPKNTKGSMTPQQLGALRDRFLHTIQSLVGQSVILTTLNGSIYKGVFHTFTPFAIPASSSRRVKSNTYVIKAVQTIKKGKSVVLAEGSTMVIPASSVLEVKVASMRIEGVRPAAAQNNGFSTDTEISRLSGCKEKDLVMASNAWVSSPTSITSANNGNPNRWERGLSLDKGASTVSGELSGKIGKWDQFEVNKQKFGVDGSFDEDLYTTKLDANDFDEEKVRKAERIASEIEGSTSTNIHVMEERGQAIQGDYDEEDLYSGVLGKHEDEKQQKESPTVMDAVKEEREEETTTEDVTTTKEEEIDPAPVSVANDDDAKPLSVKGEDEVVEGKDEKEIKTTSATTNITKSKLNPNAKSFSFNPSAPSFTPGQSTKGNQPVAAIPQGSQPQDQQTASMGGYNPYHQTQPMYATAPRMMPMHPAAYPHAPFPPHAAARYPPNFAHAPPVPMQAGYPGYGHMQPHMQHMPNHPGYGQHQQFDHHAGHNDEHGGVRRQRSNNSQQGGGYYHHNNSRNNNRNGQRRRSYNNHGNNNYSNVHNNYQNNGSQQESYKDTREQQESGTKEENV